MVNNQSGAEPNRPPASPLRRFGRVILGLAVLLSAGLAALIVFSLLSPAEDRVPYNAEGRLSGQTLALPAGRYSFILDTHDTVSGARDALPPPPIECEMTEADGSPILLDAGVHRLPGSVLNGFMGSHTFYWQAATFTARQDNPVVSCVSEHAPHYVYSGVATAHAAWLKAAAALVGLVGLADALVLASGWGAGPGRREARRVIRALAWVVAAALLAAGGPLLLLAMI